MMKKLLVYLLTFLPGAVCYAQTDMRADTTAFEIDTLNLDGFFYMRDLKEVKPTPYAAIRPNDIGSVRRIWRDIDVTREKNSYFISDESNLMSIIMEGLKSKKVTAFSAGKSRLNPTGDGFTEPIVFSKAFDSFTDSVEVPLFDDNGNETGREMRKNEFDPNSVTKFRLKEDWVYDKARGLYEPRIVGLAPLVKVKTTAGEVLSEQPAFWLNFGQLRYLLSSKKVIGQFQRLYSFDDVFVMRKFESEIVRENRPDGKYIVQYSKNPQFEAKRIEDSLKADKQKIYDYSDLRNHISEGKQNSKKVTVK